MNISPGPVSVCLYSILVILLILNIGLLVVGEWAQVSIRRYLYPLTEYYQPVSCEPKERFNRRMIHVDCPLKNQQVFYPPTEFSWNVDPFTGVFFETQVEMYQWSIRTQGFGIRLAGIWSESKIDLTILPSLLRQTHANPDFFPHVSGSGRHYAVGIYSGGYGLSPRHLQKFHNKTRLPIKQDGYYTPSEERPPTYVDYSNTHVYDDYLWTGDPLGHQIGDLRISFWGSIATHASALAMQADVGHFGHDYRLQPFPIPSHGNATIELLREGDFSPQQLIDAELKSVDPQPWVVWGIRTVALIHTFLFVFYTRKLCDPYIPDMSSVCFRSLLLALSILLFLCGSIWILCSYTVGFTLFSSTILVFTLYLFLYSRSPSTSTYAYEQQAQVHPMVYDPYADRLLLDHSTSKHRILEEPSVVGGVELSGNHPVGNNAMGHFYQPV